MQRINRPHPTTAHRRQRGITLIESLVALVISVLGIIGILGMQMRTLVDLPDRHTPRPGRAPD